MSIYGSGHARCCCPELSFFVARPLDLSCRNEPAGRGSGRSASFSFSATTLPPPEQLQSTPASQHNWRRRAAPGPGPGPAKQSQVKDARSFILFVYCLLPFGLSRPPISSSHLLSPRLRPIWVHLNKHGYPRFPRPSCASRRCQGAAVWRYPAVNHTRCNDGGLLVNNTLRTSF